MILTPTTFVIGAGASRPYGLPTAVQLHDAAKGLSPHTDLYQLIVQFGIQPVRLNAFLEDLREHPARSIDAYLESRQHDALIMKTGRAVIAVLLGDALQQSRDRDPLSGEDWLGYVFEKMRAGSRNLEHFTKGNSKVRFVTFNFDDIIERRLRRDLTRLYRSSDVEEAMKSFPVIHVHGALPPVPRLPIREKTFHGFEPEWIEWTKAATNNIRVTLDSIHEDDLITARQALAGASIICFLGFAYDIANLQRLQLPDLFDALRLAPHLHGSAFGLRAGEQATVTGRFRRKIELGGSDKHCLDVLRDFHIFRD